MSNGICKYPYTLGSTILNISCVKKSLMLEQYSLKDLADFLDKPLNEYDLKTLEKEKKKKVSKHNDEFKRERTKELKEYFLSNMDKSKRNVAMREAYLDGHSQASIAKELGVTSALVSYNIKNLKFDT